MASDNGEATYCNGRIRTNGFDPDDREKVEPGAHAGEGYCQMPAGWGTDRDGGRCKRHGGSGGRPTSHGLYSAKRTELEEKLREAHNIDRKGDLSPEIDVLRALLADFLERIGTPERADLNAAQKLLREIRRTVDTVHKQMMRERPTEEEVNQLTTRFANILRAYVPDDERRDEALNELRQAAVGDGAQHQIESGTGGE